MGRSKFKRNNEINAVKAYLRVLFAESTAVLFPAEVISFKAPAAINTIESITAKLKIKSIVDWRTELRLNVVP